MRIRVTFAKTRALIYIGNLDLYRMWERAVRRAGLPLVYSQGFHPQPKIHFAAPLPLGFSSRAEVLELRLDGEFDCEGLRARLNGVLPAGIFVIAVERADDSAPALQTEVVSADYEITLREGIEVVDLDRRIEGLLAATALPRARRIRRYDLRPLIEQLKAQEDAAGSVARITMRLRAQEGATGRPDEVLDALGIPREDARIERAGLNFRSSPPDSNPAAG